MEVETDAIGDEITIPSSENDQRIGTENDKWEIACAQLCGLGHYVRGQMFVHSKDRSRSGMAAHRRRNQYWL